MMQETRPFLVQLPIQVKTYDIDFANIVHNAVYIRWLEDLRTEVLAAHYSIEDMLADGLTPILTRTEIEYRHPVRFGDAVLGRMWVADLERTRWTVQGEICVGDVVAAASRQTGYFAQLGNGRPVRVPAQLRTIWDEENKVRE
ncbi:MAG: acyl-CoA thioesterase [Ardenticatenaceae bacterium]|nr:acyl-CoA thioesterase [Ardenticatenaceae bacterium]